MSGDEVIVTVASFGVAAIGWGRWYVMPRRMGALRRVRTARWLLDLAPLLACAAIFLVLRTAAADDVRYDPAYLALYSMLGAAWVTLTLRLLPLAGISARDDVVERGNAGAAYAIAGGILAIALCYAGGNIGNGPGWWVVVFSAALATGALFLVWVSIEALSGVSDVITIDRDASAGLRLAGLLVGCGVVFGRAVAGDWVSADATLSDFVSSGWLALVLVALAVLVERAARPTPERPTSPVFAFGLIPALVYVVVAIVHVISLGSAA